MYTVAAHVLIFWSRGKEKTMIRNVDKNPCDSFNKDDSKEEVVEEKRTSASYMLAIKSDRKQSGVQKEYTHYPKGAHRLKCHLLLDSE